jgi:hypothetical protein
MHVSFGKSLYWLVSVQDSVTAAALFTNVRRVAGGPHHEPEIYPRACSSMIGSCCLGFI